jgi:microcompartment protein CcmL/EutN
MSDTIGVMELNSIAAGVQCGDAMLKGANVELLSAQPVCAGKYQIVVRGMVADVMAAVESGRVIAADSHVDDTVIARVDPRVSAALAGAADITPKSAVGIIETFSLTASIRAADVAVKTAGVELIEIRLGRGLGGKAFVIMTGDVGSVNASVESVTNVLGESGMLAKTAVIPSLHAEMMKSLL